MPRPNRQHILLKCMLLFAVGIAVDMNPAMAQTGINDTLTTYAVVYDGDTIEAKTLTTVDLFTRVSLANKASRAKWTRLRNAIIVTYPYALRSGVILNDMNAKLETVNQKADRKVYIKTREKELKKEFTDPLSNLSIYQGKVLMKLINRQTGNNCYDIIKEYKGGFTARFYQTVAFFFSSNLKQSYDVAGDDREMEMIVREVCQTYGFSYAVFRQAM
jgi:hypothetical protein